MQPYITEHYYAARGYTRRKRVPIHILYMIHQPKFLVPFHVPCAWIQGLTKVNLPLVQFNTLFTQGQGAPALLSISDPANRSYINALSPPQNVLSHRQGFFISTVFSFVLFVAVFPFQLLGPVPFSRLYSNSLRDLKSLSSYTLSQHLHPFHTNFYSPIISTFSCEST